MTYEQLVSMAIDMKSKAYAPYSNFCVGAVLLTKDGKAYTGVNIESVSFSPTSCAERNAFFKAITEGEREFSAIAIAGSYADEDPEYCYPCGVCRQVMIEFCDADEFDVIVSKNNKDFRVHKLRELLPHSFNPRDLGK